MMSRHDIQSFLAGFQQSISMFMSIRQAIGCQHTLQLWTCRRVRAKKYCKAMRQMGVALSCSRATYIQSINDDLVDSILISCHSCGNLPPVPQPHILTLIDQGGVIVQLVVQHHVKAVAGKQTDDKHVALEGGGKAVEVVAADARCDGRRVLQAHSVRGESR